MPIHLRRNKYRYFKADEAPNVAFRSSFDTFAPWWRQHFGVNLYEMRGKGQITPSEFDKFLGMLRAGDIEMRKLAITILLEIKRNNEKRTEILS